MQIKRLVIENFKSIERIELVEPNPFTVFVGPNGSGKSNIFEALEFGNRISRSLPYETFRLFGGIEALLRRAENANSLFNLSLSYDNGSDSIQSYSLNPDEEEKIKRPTVIGGPYLITITRIENQFIDYFGRIAAYENKPRIDFQDAQALNTNASNLEPVLKRILSDSLLKEEIYEWLELFIPGFEAVEVVSGSLDNKDTLLVYEQGIKKPFTRNLISDGTYNILAMLTAVYQSDDKPQFLCIEEPENGLHPKVARELMDFFRTMCEERGHYIWVNTHSPYMASRLKPDELVTVEKINGVTVTKQFKGMNWHGLSADEAWLSNVLGSGNPW
jgi:predicted ATPase